MKKKVVMGLVFRSFKEACDFFKLKYQATYKKVQRGATLDEAFGVSWESGDYLHFFANYFNTFPDTGEIIYKNIPKGARKDLMTLEEELFGSAGFAYAKQEAAVIKGSQDNLTRLEARKEALSKKFNETSSRYVMQSTSTEIHKISKSIYFQERALRRRHLQEKIHGQKCLF